MISIDQDPPNRTRSAATFKGDVRALVISADKARSDAEIFRAAAAFMDGKPNGANFAGALRSLAHQFEQAANGLDPQAL
jgi:hypothetical protein